MSSNASHEVYQCSNNKSLGWDQSTNKTNKFLVRIHRTQLFSTAERKKHILIVSQDNTHWNYTILYTLLFLAHGYSPENLFVPEDQVNQEDQEDPEPETEGQRQNKWIVIVREEGKKGQTQFVNSEQ